MKKISVIESGMIRKGLYVLLVLFMMGAAAAWADKAGKSVKSFQFNQKSTAAPAQLNQKSTTSSATTYHGNVESKVFHRSSCRYFSCKKCTAVFKSREQASKSRYRPCQKCNP